MAQNAPRSLTVLKTTRLTPNMQRIVLTGDDLSDFPSGQESGYIKFVFSNPNQNRRILRTYTIRAFDAATRQLTVDFALHDHTEGPASRWAKTAQVGDPIAVGGPGPKKLVNNDADWFFLVGDMTSLPALACNLEQLPQNAVGHVVVEITSPADKQALTSPNGMDVHWVINTKPHVPNGAVLHKVKSLDWKHGTPSIWAACEFHTMRELRTYFKQDRGVEKDDIYISSYWKTNRSEEEHKKDKSEDLRQAEAA